MPPPVTLLHPVVSDTAKLVADAQTVALSGIVGLPGTPATELHQAIVKDGDRLTCQVQADHDYICLLPDGTDVAALALRNGAAQVKPDGPEPYQKLEALARDERRGVWSSLPPPPVKIDHPVVVTTARLVAGGRAVLLDGIEGLGGQYARDFQGYIATNGDTLLCNPQGDPGHFVCLLPDGTDIGKAALVNGAARVAADAPDAYRVEQGNALANRRGYWLNPPANVLVATRNAVAAPPRYALVAGDDGGDGISYLGGAPAVVIGGETVFLAYGGALGWGYYDHWHRWHGAPGHIYRHMEHYHPGGYGLRERGYGYGRGYAYRGGPGFRGGEVRSAGLGYRGGFNHSFVRPGAGFHPGGFGGGHGGFEAARGGHVAQVSHGGGGGGHHR